MSHGQGWFSAVCHLTCIKKSTCPSVFFSQKHLDQKTPSTPSTPVSVPSLFCSSLLYSGFVACLLPITSVSASDFVVLTPGSVQSAPGCAVSSPGLAAASSSGLPATSSPPQPVRPLSASSLQSRTRSPGTPLSRESSPRRRPAGRRGRACRRLCWRRRQRPSRCRWSCWCRLWRRRRRRLLPRRPGHRRGRAAGGRERL